MRNASGERLLWRTMERLDDVERLLLKPRPSGLGALVDNLEGCWRDLCAVELAVATGAEASCRRAGLEEVRGRVSRVAMLLDHAREMVCGWQMASDGAYGSDGSSTASSPGVVRRLDEEG